MIDTLRQVETPEGVDLKLPLAGLIPRGLAWSIDLVLRLLGYGVAAVFLAALGEVGTGLYLILLFVGEWFYPVLFEVFNGGATPGKATLGLLVVQDDGTPVGWSSSLLRNLLRFADFLPIAYGFGLTSLLLQRDFKRLGDLAAGTVVVYRPVERRVEALSDEASPLPPPVPLQRQEQLAVVEFAQRRSTWTDGRAQELAQMTGSLVTGSRREKVDQLLGLAAWLQGRR